MGEGALSGPVGDRGGVVLHAAVSLDSYLAGPDHDLGFLDEVQAAERVYDELYAGVAALVMGRTTYDVVRARASTWPYPGKPCAVVTSRPLPDAPAEVVADDGRNLTSLVAGLTRRGRVWLVGGGVLARAFLAAGLLDEVDLVITPHLLGGGSPLWPVGTAPATLHLLDVTEVGAGTVRVRYTTRTPTQADL